MNSNEQWYLDIYRQLDGMKVAIRERWIELTGSQPATETLAFICWQVWRLCNIYTHAIDAYAPPAPHAPYVPPEVSGERTERLAAMDARLEEVLGEVLDDEDDDEEEEVFDFQPSPEEVLILVQYGSIIEEYSELIEALGTAECVSSTGERWSVQNLVMDSTDGFDVLLQRLLELSLAGLRPSGVREG